MQGLLISEYCWCDGSDGCDVVDGKTYPLRVDDNKNVLEWRGKKYSLTIASADEPDGCAKSGWHAEGNGTSFTFCAATQGYGAIEDKDRNVKVRCNLNAQLETKRQQISNKDTAKVMSGACKEQVVIGQYTMSEGLRYV
jgi:hypothetical protein